VNAVFRSDAPASTPEIRIGTAGWILPKESQSHFPPRGTHLERYATRLNAVEINSSFYRPHRTTTYARWSESVPSTFRFAVKIPQQITHQRRLLDCEECLQSFHDEVSGLGPRLGPLLVQLPPSLQYDDGVAKRFFQALRRHFEREVACEPRHASWSEPAAEDLLDHFRVTRVEADPVVIPPRRRSPPPHGMIYLRWHGAPHVYYSHYAPAALRALAQRIGELQADGHPVWCIFDNTAAGAAIVNALELQQDLRQREAAPERVRGGEPATPVRSGA
jgi:uncharacterized protein YecE (DUF72 family)